MPSGDLKSRVRMEFMEMPGLKLTSAQACRLWNLGQGLCDDLLEALVVEGFLKRGTDGGYLKRAATR